MRNNYLFSTTRQWNPGDEFILFGLMRLLRDAGRQFNPIIYNRNPDVRENYTYLNPLRRLEFEFKGKGIVNSFLRLGFKDNSFKNYTDPGIVDQVFFAGSPEWQTLRLEELFRLVERRRIPVSFFGIGAWAQFSRKDIRPVVDRVLQRAEVITVRDEYTYQVMRQHYPVRYLSCPALFSAAGTREVSAVNRVALIFSTCKTLHGNRVLRHSYDRMLAFYRDFIRMNRDKEIRFVCHYIDEIEDCRNNFPGMEIEYSFDSRDYEAIYRQFDFVIGARVHGVAMGASQLIPGILFSHDARGGTGKGFGVEVLHVDALDAEAVSAGLNDPAYLAGAIARIKEAKESAYRSYQELLRR